LSVEWCVNRASYCEVLAWAQGARVTESKRRFDAFVKKTGERGRVLWEQDVDAREGRTEEGICERDGDCASEGPIDAVVRTEGMYGVLQTSGADVVSCGCDGVTCEPVDAMGDVGIDGSRFDGRFVQLAKVIDEEHHGSLEVHWGQGLRMFDFVEVEEGEEVRYSRAIRAS